MVAAMVKNWTSTKEHDMMFMEFRYQRPVAFRKYKERRMLYDIL